MAHHEHSSLRSEMLTLRQREQDAQRRRQARAAPRHVTWLSPPGPFSCRGTARPWACACTPSVAKLHTPASASSQECASAALSSVAPHSPCTLRPSHWAAERGRTIGARVRAHRPLRQAAIDPERKPAGTWAHIWGRAPGHIYIYGGGHLGTYMGAGTWARMYVHPGHIKHRRIGHEGAGSRTWRVASIQQLGVPAEAWLGLAPAASSHSCQR